MNIEYIYIYIEGVTLICLEIHGIDWFSRNKTLEEDL